MPWGAVAGAAVGLIGSSMQADAAGDAAEGQQRASQESNALQRYMYDNNVALQMPNINTGNAARDRLSYLLGLSPTGYSNGAGGGRTPTYTYDQLRSQLLGQYTKQPTAGTGAPQYRNGQEAIAALGQQGAHDYFQNRNTQNAETDLSHLWGGAPEGAIWSPGSGDANTGVHGDTWSMPEQQAPGATIDEAGLDAAIRARLAEQDAAQRAMEEAAKNDPNYGRLAQQFEFEKYTPGTFSYTGEDLYKDPSYLFRLQQGQKALDRQGAAAGRFLSGRQLQASSDYNQGAASQEFQNAYQRALGTFGTNEGNRFNAFTTNEGNRFNAYQANFNNAVNPLLALAGAATLGSQNLGSAGASVANQVGQNLTNNANAQGAAGIAGANSIAGGLNNAYSGYQQNQLMNSIMNNNRGGSVNNNPGAWNTNATNWAFGTGGMGD